MPAKNVNHDPSLLQKLNQTPAQKMSPRLMMSAHMQQAIRLMQIPVIALAAEIEEQMTLNPLLEYSDETVSVGEQEDFDNADPSPEQELVFDEHQLEILQHLDEEFQDYMSETDSSYTKRTTEDDKKRTFQESLILDQLSLYESLMAQAEQIFQDKEHLSMAQAIIGNIDENGFFQTPLKEVSALNNFDITPLQTVLDIIKTMDPPGIGASSVQESLLIQLRRQHKEKTLAYRLIEQCYDDLIHNRIRLIEKQLKCTAEQIRQTIDCEIGRLDIHPGTQFSHEHFQTVLPDVSLRQDGDKLVIESNKDDIPALRINTKYLRMLQNDSVPKDTKDFIRHHLISAKWLMRTIRQRQSTIERIAAYLAEHQADYLTNPEGKLQPLTMKTVAEELELHESTVARAVANKYIHTPRGMLPLREFFTNAIVMPQGEDLSSKTVRDTIVDMIKEEDKSKPLSDQAISNRLKATGIPCARRTVAKYRVELNLGTALQRKKF